MSTKNTNKPKEYSQPTLEKNGESALFYNLAYNRISEYIKLQEKNAEDELRKYFGDNDISHEKFSESLFSESTYTNLKIYLWKEQKGGKIKYIKPWEKQMINHMLHLLWRLRDYHSHYWHDDSGIVIFKEDFRAFLVEKFNEALSSYESRYPFAKKYHKDQPPILINPITNKFNTEGVNFYLSFFLTKSQMELFMNNREYLKMKGVKREAKNAESIRDFDFIRKVNTHFCLSDGHQLNIASLKKEDTLFDEYLANKIINSEEGLRLDKQSLEILKIETENYLNSIPSYLYDEINIDKKKDQVKRLNNNYLPLLSQYIALHTTKFLKDKYDKRQINWKVTEYTIEKRNPIRKEELREISENENKQIPNDYDKIVHNFNTNFGIQFKIDPSDESKVIQYYNKPYTDKNLTAIELVFADNSKIRFNVGLKALTHWATMIIGGHISKVVNNLFVFAEEYKQLVEYIRYRTNNFDLENTQYLKMFCNKGVSGDKNAIGLQVPQPLLDAYFSIKNNTFLEIPVEELREKMLQKTKSRINVLEKLKSNVVPTNYHEYKMSAELIKEYNNLKSEYNLYGKNFANTKRLDELDALVKEDKKIQKKNTKVRFQKMKELLFVMKWILEKSKKFNDPKQKKAVCKYIYLLDDKTSAKKFLQEDNVEKSNSDLALYSASEWLTRLATKEEYQTEENPQLKERQVLHDILLATATSFDDAYIKIIDLAIEKYKLLQTTINKHIETDTNEKSSGKTPTIEAVQGRLMWLLQRSKELDITNKSLTLSANSDFREATKNEVDRINELIIPYTFRYNYIDENNFQEGYIFGLPNWFFETIDNFKEKFIATKNTHIVQFVEEKRKQYQEYFKHIQNTKPYLVSKDSFANKLQKEDFKKARTFYQDMIHDALLHKLKNDYFNLQSHKFDIKHTRSKDFKVEHTISGIKLQTFIPIKLLQRNNGAIHKKHILKMMELLYKKEIQKKDERQNYEPRTTFEYQTIVQRLQSYHQKSIKYVSEILTAEKEYGEAQGWTQITNKIDLVNNPIPQEFEYKKFSEFKTYFENKYVNSFEDIEKQLRNKIFHLDVSEKGFECYLKTKQ